MKKLNQSGFSHVLIFVAVGLCFGMALIAYRAVNSNQPVAQTSTPAASVPATLKTTADLNTAVKALDVSSESDVNPDQLNADLNALL